MASRALSARLSRAFSSWLPSALSRQSAPASTVSNEIAPPSVRRRNSPKPATSLLASIGFGASGCWREKASSRPVSVTARWAPSNAISRARAMRAAADEVPQRGDLAADHVEAAEDDGEQIVEVVCDPAGELADRLHLLRLPQRFLRLAAGLVLGLQLARALLDGFLQRLGERAQLRERALALGHVDGDADDADRTAMRVVENDAARFHPFQRAVARRDDAELGLPLACLRREGVLDQVGDARAILAQDRPQPGLVTAVEIRQSVE